MKNWWGGATILAACAGIFVLVVVAKSVPPQPAQVDSETATSSFIPVSMVFVGDIMLDRGVRKSVDYNFNGNYDELFKNTAYLTSADIAFANLEGPAATTGHKVGSVYSFRMDPKVIESIARAGFDIVSFANNHIGDYTQQAFDETRQHLTDNKILYAGAGNNYADATTPRIITVRGVKIGFLAATDVGPEWMKATDTDSGVLLASDPNLVSIVQKAKTQVDVLVFSLHWGEEYKPATNRQKTLAHHLIDAGVDVIVGSHPHVAQEVEVYKGKPIFYSLGNFIFDQPFSEQTMQGMVATVTIGDDLQLHYQTNTVRLDRRFQPQPLSVTETAVDNTTISENTCPKPVQAGGIDLSLVSIPVPYSLIGYVPDDLVPVGMQDTDDPFCLRKDAGAAFVRMNTAMKPEGLGLTVTTAYRAEADQAEIKTAFNAQNMTAYVADVGSSEHQLGTAADFGSISGGTFVNSGEYKWLKTHAATYGFVQSYPPGREKETGYPAEAWHWRYVGSTLAQKIVASGKTVNTYLKSTEQQ